jgi:hypothetical protein
VRSVVTLPASTCTAAGVTSPAPAWVATPTSSTCAIASEVGDRLTQYRSSSSASSTGVPPACRNALSGLTGTTVYLPVFEQSGTSAGVPWYQVAGFAAFRVSGVTSSTGGGGSWTWLDFFIWLFGGGGPSGGGQDSALRLQGWFTTAVSLGDGALDSSAPDLGVRTIHLVDPKA